MNLLYFRQTWAIFKEAVKSFWQLSRASYKIAQLRTPIITIFGATEMEKTSVYYERAFTFAKRCAEHNISVITGGGPGIMYAANCGAKAVKSDDKKYNTLGIAVYGVDEKFENRCSPLVWVDNFFTRKWLLIHYSIAIVVFPGGIGTADELFEVLNNLKHGKPPLRPLILVGADFWKPIIHWMTEQSIAHGYMRAEYLSFFFVTDSIDEAFDRIKSVIDRA